MRELFNQIFDNVFFKDVFFVTENPGIIEIENIFKKDNKIVTENIKKEYSLPNYELKNDDIKSELLHKLFVILNFSERADIKYFNRGLFKNIFTRKNPNILFNEIIKWDWVITTPKIISELKKLKQFNLVENDKFIKRVGVLNNTIIYQKEFQNFDEDVIYLANYDSITPIINENIIKEDNKIHIEYQFNMTGKTKKIILS